MAHVVEEELLTLEEAEIFDKVAQIMHDFPDMKFGKNGEFLLSCHMVTRALAVLFPSLTVKDGYFGRVGITHSWLVTPTRTFEIPEGNIVDPYPAGGRGAILAWNGLNSPWRPLYMEAVIQVVETEDFLHYLEYVKKMVKRKAEVLKIIPTAE